MPTRLRSVLIAVSVAMLMPMSACGGASDQSGGADEKTPSAEATSTDQGAPKEALCKGLDLAPMSKILGTPAKVSYDLVAGDTPPYGGPAATDPTCELSGGKLHLTFEASPKVRTAQDLDDDLQLNRQGAATLGATCSPSKIATAGSMKGGVHTCKLKTGYSAFLVVLVDRWALRCSAYGVDGPDEAIKLTTDACGAMLKHLSA